MIDILLRLVELFAGRGGKSREQIDREIDDALRRRREKRPR